MAVTYTTIQGDRWDVISFRLFGSEFYTNDLFEANTDYADVAIFSAGIVLNVPDVVVEQAQLIAPWLRQTVNDDESDSELIPSINIEFNTLFSYRWIDNWTAKIRESCRLGVK